MECSKLTVELMRFCRRNLRELSAWAGHTDPDFARIAGTHWDNLSRSVNSRLANLGLRGMREGGWRDPLTTEEIMASLGPVKALVDAGSLEALVALLEIAKISATKVRGMERKQYLKIHPSYLPWKAKPAEQHREALANARGGQIKDREVNRMLDDLEKKIADDDGGQ
jgi:hypothetical protein